MFPTALFRSIPIRLVAHLRRSCLLLCVITILVPEAYPQEIDLEIALGPVNRTAVFDDARWSHWGGSVIKDSDGLYHMLYSRWPKKAWLGLGN